MTADPYAWNPPSTPPETWSDAGWLRAEARANFVTEDIELADEIARLLDAMPAALAVVRSELNLLAQPVAGDVVAELADLTRQLRTVEEAVSMCVGLANRHDLSAYLDRRGVTAIKI